MTETRFQRTDSVTTPDVPQNLLVLTSYVIGKNHTLLTISRCLRDDWKFEMKANAKHIAKGDDAGIVINKASVIENLKKQSTPPHAKMSFKVSLQNSETDQLFYELRTLRFWLKQSHSSFDNNNQRDYSSNNKRVSTTATSLASQLAQTYFCHLIGTKPDDDFPKAYSAFIMKLMRLLKNHQFHLITNMEVELRQLPQEEHAKSPSQASSIDGGSSGSGSHLDLSNTNTGGTNNRNGRGSPLTSQKVLDIIESSYPNPISIRDICLNLQTEPSNPSLSSHQDQEVLVRKFLGELASKEKINSTDGGQHFTRITKLIDTKINLVKQMPKVIKAQQPVIAIITAQYCEKLAVDSMISDKETFVRYRTTTTTNSNSDSVTELAATSSANYVYTLGNIGGHRVVSTKLTSVGHSRGALIAAGNATTRLLGTFPELEYIFLVGCAGGVPNYADFSAHVRLGDVVISHIAPSNELVDSHESREQKMDRSSNRSSLSDEYIYVHCRPEQHQKQQNLTAGKRIGSMMASYSVHKSLKQVADKGSENNQSYGRDRQNALERVEESQPSKQEQLTYDQCHFRLWRPAKLDLQVVAQRLWLQSLENPKSRIWQYYIEEGIKSLKQQDIEAVRPPSETDKLFMASIEVSHPEAGDNELDLRRDGWPMCHFGPIGSAALDTTSMSEPLKQRMISEFQLRAFDSEFDPVVESIYGNCKESYIMIRGISDYKDGRKRNNWQQYSALAAAAFMKSIIVNLEPLGQGGC